MDRGFAVCLPKRGLMTSQLSRFNIDVVKFNYNYLTISPVVYTTRPDNDDLFY
jgi:hypothetical protein